MRIMTVEEATCLHEVVIAIIMNTVLFVINYHDWNNDSMGRRRSSSECQS